MLIILYFFQDMQRHLLLELILFLCLLLSAKFSQMYMLVWTLQMLMMLVSPGNYVGVQISKELRKGLWGLLQLRFQSCYQGALEGFCWRWMRHLKMGIFCLAVLRQFRRLVNFLRGDCLKVVSSGVREVLQLLLGKAAVCCQYLKI